ncbi:MAG: DUF6134 family protein [Granulosicoccus sp.]
MKATESARRKWLVTMLLVLSSTTLQSQQQTQVPFASKNLASVVADYPNPVRYTVTRNGKTIGEHVLSFTVEDNRTVVRVNSAVKVRFLGIPVYSLSYVSEESWVDNELVHASAQTIENGKSNTVTYDLNNTDEQAAYASNHWHPGVVFSPRIFNTLTGEVEQVEISTGISDNTATADGSLLDAFRFTYNYEIPLDSWYDVGGLWVKMAFKRDDGSVIEYTRND